MKETKRVALLKIPVSGICKQTLVYKDQPQLSRRNALSESEFREAHQNNDTAQAYLFPVSELSELSELGKRTIHEWDSVLALRIKPKNKSGRN